MTELGNHKADFEEWFPAWDSVLFLPNPRLSEREIGLYGHNGEVGTIPCHQHRRCKSKVVARTPFPPRVCPGCHADTLKEIKSQPKQERDLWLPYR